MSQLRFRSQGSGQHLFATLFSVPPSPTSLLQPLRGCTPPITRARIADELYGTCAKMSIVNPATITDAELPSPQGKPLTKILYPGSIISLVWILQGGREVDHQGKGGCSSGGGGGGGYKVHLPPGVPPHKRNKCSPVHSMTFFFCRGATPQAIECIIGEHGLYDVITHFDI